MCRLPCLGEFKRSTSWLPLVAALAILAPRPVRGATLPPHLKFRTVSSSRVSVHYHQGLEPLARKAASLATEILASLEARYGVRVGRVQVVLTDVDDEPNAFATPLPYPLVHVRAVAPSGGDEFGNLEDWLRLVLTHELAHIVHLEEARGLFRVGRKVFGRAPFLFPNTLTPSWMIEGLATYEETEGTAFGRGRSSDSRMVLRMAALEGDFPREDRPVTGLDRWPGGQAAYVFGEGFLRGVTERFGKNALPELARVHSARVIPFLDDLTARRVTGASFHTRWAEWRQETRAAFFGEAEALRERGLTTSRALTFRGIRQAGPRFSPDGHWIAYTNRNLTRFRAIHVVGADGSDDRRVAWRNGGASLAWTPDGRAIVFDEPEVHKLFSKYSDLRIVDLATGRVRPITRGVRARQPDVSPDGTRVVFVRQTSDRSELATVGLDGSGLSDLTHSEPGTQWSHPRVSPRGDVVAASRWLPGGLMDLVLVDLMSGSVSALMADRAREAEPTWTPDGSHVLFRSDRDGISNLYALRLADRALLRVTRVLGGAFSPDVSPDGREVAFANYGSAGYDIHLAALDTGGLFPAPPFEDSFPHPRPDAPAILEPDRPYRPLPHMLPRFWSPYATTSSDETVLGVVTAGADSLLRHVYGGELHWGSATERVGFRAFYQYDRFRPTFLLTAENTYEPGGEGILHTREVGLRAQLPVVRTLRASHSLSLAWRHKVETVTSSTESDRLALGGLELAWFLSTVKQYPYSISPMDGQRLRVAYLKEDPFFGSDVSLGKLIGDARGYFRCFGESDVLGVRLGGGTTVGRPTFRRSFAVGGFPEGGLFDVVRTNHTVLRGYPDDAFTGRSFVHVNLEYRFPLAHPQAGFRSFPFFVRHLHAAVFADAAHAWSGAFALRDVKTSVGGALGIDLHLGHAVPLTMTAGLGRGLAEKGETRFYVRAGLAF